ncbi:MAG: asparagine synthase (glutamine-hydrolyzing) [Phycisphaerales bacterium]|nr:asparagine synthase (glutamine-hydrolyzing) [Phycisphaerales bacterium]
MCGIAGFILDEINPQATAWLTAMTQRLYHRGPDDGGAVVFGMNASPTVCRELGSADGTVDWSYVPVKLGLGARRLAVVDRSSAGHQPMSSSDGRVWLVYNGEIYNHAAVRSELLDRGMHFEGRSDTEVLLSAYRAWGVNCFERLEGMWAVAIVDWAAGRMVLSRDRFGIKPLYVSRFDGGMAFASEIKSLVVLPGAPEGVHEARLRDFLCDGRVDHTDDTLFENIWSAPAGCWIELDLRARGTMHAGGSVHRYWRPRYGWADASEEPRQIARLLSESVTAHLQGDVPIGSCLSGGLDSSAIVSIAHRQGTECVESFQHWTQHAFTASLPGCDLDETKYAKIVAEACPGLQSHFIEPTPQRLSEDMTSLMWHQEQPFGSPSIYLQWEVMRLAREVGITVLLDGQGGDELFCGYEGYIPPYLAHLLRRGRVPAFQREYRAAKRHHFPTDGLLKHVVAALLPEATRRRWRLRGHMRQQPWLVRDLFSAEELPGMCEVLELTPPDSVQGTWRDAALSQRLWAVLLQDSLPSLLRFEDRNSMAFSIEARVPFLARDFVELAMSLPVSRKIKDGVLKVALREAMKDIVPDTILNRNDKIGFSAPTAAWMRGGLRDWWQEALTSRSFLDRGCFEPKGVLGLIKRFDAGDEAVAHHLWRLAAVEQWARQFLDQR